MKTLYFIKRPLYYTLIWLCSISISQNAYANCSPIDTSNCTGILQCTPDSIFSLAIYGNSLNDASFGPVALSFPFRFGNNDYTQLFINSNGNLSFGLPYLEHNTTTGGFPNQIPMIAPFFADIDILSAGQIYWTYIADFNNSGEPAFVVTWDHVTLFDDDPTSNPRNTFQVILVPSASNALPDGHNVMFLYSDMNWAGNALDSPFAIIGVNYGDGIHFEYLANGIYDTASTDTTIPSNIKNLEYSCICLNTACDLNVSLLPESQTLCDDMLTLAASGNWDSYEWNTNETADAITVNEAGSYNLTVEDQRGCLFRDTIEIYETANIIELPTTICPNTLPVTLVTQANTAAFVNGVESTNLSFDNTIANNFHTIISHYNIGQSCAFRDTQVVFVAANVVINITDAPPQLCTNEGILELKAIPLGGYFSSSFGIIDSINGLFDPNEAAIGSNKISYTYEDAQSCLYTDCINMDVFVPPIATIYMPQTIFCESDAAIEIPLFPLGGILSINDVVQNEAILSPSALGIGEHIISYSVTDPNTACSNEAIAIIEIVAIQTPTIINLPTDYCLNGEAIALEAVPQGGVFYINNEILPNGIFNPAFLVEGTYTIGYRFPNGSDCFSDAEASIELHTADTPMLLNLPFDICQYDAPFIVDVNQTNGIFEPTPYIDSEGLFNPAEAPLNQLVPIIYTYSSSIGCEVTITDFIYVSEGAIASIDIITDDLLFCTNDDTLYELIGTPPNGSFFGEGIIQLGGATYFRPSLVENITEVTIEYQYSTANNFACQSTAIEKIQLVEPVNGSIEGLDEIICANDAPIELIGIPANGIFQGVGINGTTFTPSFDLPVGNTTIVYTAEDANNCSVSVSETINIFHAPTINFALPQSTFCNNQDAILLNPIPINGVFSTQNIVNNQFFPSLFEVGEHELSYTYFDGQCASVETVNFEILPAPSVTITNDDFKHCINDLPILLEASDNQSIFQGAGVNNNEFIPATAGLGAHLITCNLLDSNGCTASDFAVFEVEPSPVSNFTYIYECETYQLAFKNLSYGVGELTHLWNIHDDNAAPLSAIEEPIYTFDDTGFYDVTLLVESENGCTASITEEVFVPEQNRSNIAISDSVLIVGDTLWVSALSAAEIDNYFWIFEAGRTNTEQSTAHVFNQAGIYDIFLQTTDEFGCQTETMERVLVQNNLDIEFEILKLYPNPSNGLFNVEFYLPESIFLRVEIYNLLGQLMRSSPLNRVNRGIRNIEFSLEGLAEGVYFLKFIDGDKNNLTAPSIFQQGELYAEQLKFQQYLKVVYWP